VPIEMIVLGFDTATPSTAVGLRLADGRSLDARDTPRPGEHPGHATRLLAMADELLAAAGVGWGALDRIAVGIGPGLFTGLRVGVATARGLAQSLSVELVGVSSLRALAQAAAEQGQERLLAVVDARRGEAFTAAYAADAGSISELVSPRALAPAQLEGLVAEAERAGGQTGERWLAVGDGAVRFREQLRSAAIAVPADSSPLHLVAGATVCELGAAVPAACPNERVVPDYLRRPDAEITLERIAAVQGVER
jgi:tRNA threonylcarbamoyladenosine biosynthesis protein TsaB